MEYLVGSTALVFDLPVGIYTAWPESAVGKTYTYKLLCSLVAGGNTGILPLTYESVKILSTEGIVQLIQEKPRELIFVDRADLYVNRDIFEALAESEAVVYLDRKSSFRDPTVCGKDCEVIFTEKEIRYYVDTV